MKKEEREGERVTDTRNEKLLRKKFYLDKLGYGFSSPQFINILFYFTGASFFLIGLINGLKSFINTGLATLIKEISQRKEISKRIISISGLIFGFSFIFLSFAVILKLPLLFAVIILISGASVTAYGELFNDFLNKYSKKGKINRLSYFSTFKGLFLAAISIILAAGIIDLTVLDGDLITIKLLGKTITQKIYGYLITFEITALAFILSSYIFSKIKVNQQYLIKAIDYKEYYRILISKSKIFFKNKYLMIMSITTLTISVFQSIINSFTGIYVYTHLKNLWFGGFMNIAIMFSVALIVAILGPFISETANKKIGVVPMFVFGTILLAILPLTIVHNPLFFPAMVAANALSVLGASLIGSAQGFLASKVLSVEDRNIFYSASGFLSMFPFLIIVTFLSYIVHVKGILYVFEIIGYGLIAIAVPLYFLIVIWSLKQKKV